MPSLFATGFADVVFISVGVGIFFLVYLWFCKISPALKALAAPISFLGRLADGHALVDNFVALHTLMTNAAVVRHGWAEFVKSFPEQGSDHPTKIEIIIRPGVFLNISEAERSGLRLGALGRLGGVFVALGGALGFMLLIGVLLAGPEAVIAEGQDRPDLVILAAMIVLIKGASPMVWASLAGIATGLLILFTKWMWMSRLAGAFDRLTQELERLTVTITPATILSRTYAEIREQSGAQRRFADAFGLTLGHILQTVMIESAPREIAAAVGLTLQQTMPKILSDAMAQAMGPVAVSLDRMTGEVGGAVEAAVGRDLGAVTQALSALPAEITAAAAVLHEATHRAEDCLKETARTLASSADAAGRTFAGRVETLASDLHIASNRSAETIATAFVEAAIRMQGSVFDATRQIETTAAHLRQPIVELASALGTVEARIATHVTALEGVNRSTYEAESALSKAAQSLADTALPLTKTAELVTQTMTTVVRNVETAVRGLTESQRLAGQLSTDLKQAVQELKAQRSAGGPVGRPSPVWGGSKKP